MDDQRPTTSSSAPNTLDSDRTLKTAEGAPLPSTAKTFPETIGHYRILCLIGEGGMGAVYKAEQDHPRRLVALKVIKAGWASPEMLRRFEQESQALGRLHHPGIAQIFEAGSADTGFGVQPFFAMELIQGKPLMEYADRHKLNPRQRLALMIQLCDAVQHAHQRGIIHRDLKPGNILVDEFGKPKILDFGLARATDSDAQATRQTGMGELLGTLAYMSPEQVLADPLAVDTRSDVYALGVILYELLAGKMPYTLSRQLHEAVRTIQQTDAAPLSAVSRVYRGDIETIVAKALEKDKNRRYGSAAALAGDLQRYLDDQPITAKPASTSYQLQKFARRHKALMAGVAAVFVVLVLGIVASTWEAVKARRAEKKAEQESAIAQAVNDFLQNDLLGQASASKQSGSSAKPDPDIKVRTVLDRAAARISGKFDKQPEVEASIRKTIGDAYHDLGLYPEARKQLEQALDFYRRVLGPENPKTIYTTNSLGEVAYFQGEYAEAEALSSQALEIERRVLGPEHPGTLSAMNNLGNVYDAEGKYAQAEALESQTLDGARRTLGAEHPRTLSAMMNLAMTYEMEGKYAQAEALDNQTLEIKRRVLGSEHPETLESVNHLANIYLYEGKYAQAEVLYNQTLEIRRRLLGPEHLDTLESMANLVETYSAQGKYPQAEELGTATLKICRRVLGPRHLYTLASMNNLADAYTEQGKYAQAEVLHSEALSIASRARGPEHPATLDTLADFASMYQRQGNYALAETYAAQALAGRRHALGSEHPETIESVADLALACQSQGKFTESEPLAREAFEVNQKKQPDDWQRFRAESLLGASLAGQKKYAEAEPLLLEGYQGMAARKERIAVPDHYHLERAREWLAQLYLAWGKPDKAAEWAKH